MWDSDGSYRAMERVGPAMKVLIVDDDPEILDAVSVGFRFQWREGTVLTATNAADGLAQFYRHTPDLVVLDVNMPDRSGFDVLQELRRVSDVPVILLTGRQSEASEVRGLDLGADDYITKPFSILALLARIRAILRRADADALDAGNRELVVGDLVIDERNRRVVRHGELIDLTPSEFRLLLQFARAPQRLLPHQMLLERVWGSNWEASQSDLKSLVSRLRAKLGEDPRHPRYIETQRGIGYRFLLWPQAAETVRQEDST
jgi:DNA-binding response OmpR family regulator